MNNNQAIEQIKIEVFEYNGAPISFDLGGETPYINATQMAKSFGKQPKDYLVTARAQELVSAIQDEFAARGNLLPLNLVKIINGNSGGTWLHKDLALDFARWLSAPFAFWCDRKTQELLLNGSVALSAPQDPILGILYALTETRKDTLALKSRIDVLEEKESARADIMAILPFVPEKTNRARLTEIMESHGGRTENYSAGWQQLYKEYERRFHVDIPTRAKNAKLSGPHWAEKYGKIDNLLALAVKLFG